MINEIVKKIEQLSGKYSGYEIFADWVKAMAIAISNATEMTNNDVYIKREEQYIEIAKKHGENMKEFSQMLLMLEIALENNITDVLGEVYMRASLGSKQTGQFFTPFHLSLLTANTVIPKDVSIENPLVINEPSTGAGGMIIAAAKILKDRGLNPQKCMKVVAQDLDWKGVYMTYVQLSLLGIKAIVVQGDTLCEPFHENKYPKERVLYTPAQKGLVL